MLKVYSNFRLLCLFLICVLLAQVSQATTYYVAKTGSDTNPGTNLTAPVLTIQKAASLMAAGDTCFIRAGVYRETVTPNSGTSTSRITFAPYAGELVTVSGADALSLTWSVHTGSIYKATTTSSFRQLFVDGNMMNEARWPNAQVNDLLNAPRAKVQSGTTNGLSLTDPSLPNVTLIGATLHLFPGAPGGEWSAFTRPITGYDSVAKTISWSVPTSTWGEAAYLATGGNPYYLYGSLSLLDAPTEWYLDDAANLLYLWTPNNTSPVSHTVEMKARTEAFVLDNKTNVTVSGLYVFAAGISMLNTTGCIVDGCHLRYIQHDTTADWTKNNTFAACGVSGTGSIWKNSSITFSSQDGIELRGNAALVTNCVIRNVDYYPGSYYASVTAYGANHKIIGNTLTDSGRYLVWHPFVTANEYAYNDMAKGQRLTGDGGATYVFHADGAGTTIHHNWVHDSLTGIYLDNSSTNFVVYRNVCYNNLVTNIRLNSPSINNIVCNNTLVGGLVSFAVWPNTGSQAGTRVINNLVDGSMAFCADVIQAKNGWFPPVGTDCVPQTGSGAINGGNIFSPYTDGYSGAAPDIGAYEVGLAHWTAGSLLSVPPFPGYGIPAPPSGLSASSDNVNLKISLNWAEPTGAASYKLKRAIVSGGPYTTISTQTTLSFTDTNIVRATRYYYVVSALNASGESPNSVEVGASAGLPVGWLDQDIGATGTTGDGNYNGGIFTIKGAGNDIGTSPDSFNYAYQSMTGDGTFIARLTTEIIGSGNDKVGLMMRETTNSNSAFVLLLYNAGHGKLATRATTGAGLTWVDGPAITLPQWFKLVRAANTFTGYISPDGSTWTLVGSSSATLASAIKIGFAVCSRNTGVLNTSTFDNVVAPGYTPPPVAPTGLTATISGSSQINLTWTGSGGASGYNVKRATSSGGPYTAVATGVASTSYSDTGLVSSTAYYYVVSAVNVGGESPNSIQASNKRLLPGLTIALRAIVNNQYVSAPNAGTNALIASRPTVGPWEKFTVVDAGNGNIGFRAIVNNQYVSADNAGASPLIANRATVSIWETFTEFDAGSGNIGLRALVNSQYVSADNAGASPLIANRATISIWETFTVSVP